MREIKAQAKRGASMDGSRQFRGTFGMAITWGIALSALATGILALGLSTEFVPSSIFGAREVVAVAVRGLLVGGVAGGLFAWLVARRERGRTPSTLSPRRVAIWGCIAAGSVPALLTLASTGPVLPLGILVAATAGFGGIGSLLGTATLHSARRADARLLRADDEPSRLIR